jgi:hypothetical protein
MKNKFVTKLWYSLCENIWFREGTLLTTPRAILNEMFGNLHHVHRTITYPI